MARAAERGKPHASPRTLGSRDAGCCRGAPVARRACMHPHARPCRRHAAAMQQPCGRHATVCDPHVNPMQLATPGLRLVLDPLMYLRVLGEPNASSTWAAGPWEPGGGAAGNSSGGGGAAAGSAGGALAPRHTMRGAARLAGLGGASVGSSGGGGGASNGSSAGGGGGSIGGGNLPLLIHMTMGSKHKVPPHQARSPTSLKGWGAEAAAAARHRGLDRVHARTAPSCRPPQGRLPLGGHMHANTHEYTSRSCCRPPPCRCCRFCLGGALTGATRCSCTMTQTSRATWPSEWGWCGQQDVGACPALGLSRRMVGHGMGWCLGRRMAWPGAQGWRWPRAETGIKHGLAPGEAWGIV